MEQGSNRLWWSNGPNSSWSFQAYLTTSQESETTLGENLWGWSQLPLGIPISSVCSERGMFHGASHPLSATRPVCFVGDSPIPVTDWTALDMSPVPPPRPQRSRATSSQWNTQRNASSDPRGREQWKLYLWEVLLGLAGPLLFHILSYFRSPSNDRVLMSSEDRYLCSHSGSLIWAPNGSLDFARIWAFSLLYVAFMFLNHI